METLTVKEVAAKLKYNRATVIKRIKCGQLQAMRDGREYRISEEALAKYQEKFQVEVK